METVQKLLHPTSLLQGERVCVVTGSDRGIGYAVAKGLLQQNPSWVVYITSPDENAGRAAVQRLHDDNSLSARFFKLDIDDLSSIRNFRDHIRENHKNGIHILVNNAGVFPDDTMGGHAHTGFEACCQPAETTSAQQTTITKETRVESEVSAAGQEVGGGSTTETSSEETKERGQEPSAKEQVKFHYNREAYKRIFENNYFSTLNVCRELFPLLGDDSSVIFVGSRLANLCFMATKEDKQLLLRGCTRVEDCSKIMEDLMNADPEKLYNPEDKDDPNAWLAKSPDTEIIPGYKLGIIYPWAMAKLGLAIVCRLYQLQFDSEKQAKNVHIVTCCPGLVKTDMNPMGTRTPDEGADTIVWSALQPKDSDIRGVVCADRKMCDPFVLPEGSAIF